MADNKQVVSDVSRRTLLKAVGAGAGAMALGGTLPGSAGFVQAQSAAPIKIGFQKHATGIMGGINGRPVEIVTEDDGTDPKRGSEVLEKFANQHGCDVAFGTLFSHVVIGSAPRAGELKLPYFVVSEGHHVASGALNRYTLQPGITDVKSQVISMAPFVADNLGKKVTMIYPDFAFGHDHRDYFSAAIEAQGGEVLEKIAIPPTETSFTRYFPRIPRETEVVYHVMVGPAVLTFVKEMGEFFGPNRPEIFGYSSTEYDAAYRAAVGVDDRGASLADSKDVSTYAHMFGCWETLNIIKAGMETANYQGPADRAKLIEAVESMTVMMPSLDHPQGPKIFNGKTHQTFGLQYISQVQDGKMVLKHTTSIEDSLYEDEVDYTAQSF